MDPLHPPWSNPMMSSFGISRDQVFRRPWKRSPYKLRDGPPTSPELRSASPTHPTSGMGVGMRPWTWDSDTNASAFDLTSGTFTVPSSFEFALENGTAVEYHWQMRSIVDHRIGAWSTAAGFCVPDAHGTDDGTANYTVILREGRSARVIPSTLTGRSRTAPPSSTTASIRPWTSVRTVPGPDKLTASSPSISGITGSRMR